MTEELKRMSIQITTEQQRELQNHLIWGEKSQLFFNLIDDIVYLTHQYPRVVSDLVHRRIHIWDIGLEIAKARKERENEPQRTEE